MQLQNNIDKNCKKCQTLHISGSVKVPLSYKQNLLDMELFPWEYPMIYILQNYNPFIRNASKVLTSCLTKWYNITFISPFNTILKFKFKFNKKLISKL